ncbi:50S ribosomal protein L29 [Candidatus Azambacteria bacterium RIFCSPLOWO2_01_FULL_37_9]|uniref:Large ribosomal subunit protein uL29 n=1 Tax=Candidatus Azambacteria bacterium RIFCSPLOWO2_01_FULL_37_9 TaxID=1797297 RepID=A0A1F5C6F3_9BACT|nr:MAG: 50S ribosomal protein L29 [Candidatus Moranbacteria bacterium GW2011_GWF2_37_7]KKQ58221.1 MAG: 50S ribosomal protein L29 [Parcubacteria group bacterium GW2011_GWD1_38_16]OGD38422.1 MAG: 50S ribosomal protein L29 [Candidatus Azambacteria bacterium RIFCSPLOWO2_01_FULL_37_9]
MTKEKELQDKNQEELIKILKEKQNRLLELRFGASVKNVKDTSEFQKIRKDIARILTIINKK